MTWTRLCCNTTQKLEKKLAQESFQNNIAFIVILFSDYQDYKHLWNYQLGSKQEDGKKVKFNTTWSSHFCLQVNQFYFYICAGPQYHSFTTT